MRKILFAALGLALLFITGCKETLPAVPTPIRLPQNAVSPTPTLIGGNDPVIVTPTAPPASPTVPPTETPVPAAAGWRRPPLHTTWQIQYAGDMDFSPPVGVFNLDLFETSADEIALLHERGIYVMCYFSAGSWEDWRPDADRFPEDVLGKDLEGWEGEKWLDIRRLDVLAPIMTTRMEMAVQKDCDGVDPDNINGYEEGNDTGFPLTYEDQLTYNRFLAETAHRLGLSIGLKNDIEQISDLVDDFDWELNESCFYYDECDLLLPFLAQNKPVFVIEYETQPEAFCPQANRMGFNALFKNWDLDAMRVDCRAGSYQP